MFSRAIKSRLLNVEKYTILAFAFFFAFFFPSLPCSVDKAEAARCHKRNVARRLRSKKRKGGENNRKFRNAELWKKTINQVFPHRDDESRGGGMEKNFALSSSFLNRLRFSASLKQLSSRAS